MGRPNRIVELDLEEVVKIGLSESRTRPAIVALLNAELTDRYSDEPKGKRPRPITLSALDRYLARTNIETATLAHTPQAAKENASFALNFEQRFMDSLKRLDKMMTAFDDLFGGLDERTDENGDPLTEGGKSLLIASLAQAHVPVLREHREHLKLYADLMERIYNAKQVERFQRTVMTVIGEAAPEVQREIERRMREDADGRRAAMLGMTAA